MGRGPRSNIVRNKQQWREAASWMQKKTPAVNLDWVGPNSQRTHSQWLFRFQWGCEWMFPLVQDWDTSWLINYIPNTWKTFPTVRIGCVVTILCIPPSCNYKCGQPNYKHLFLVYVVKQLPPILTCEVNETWCSIDFTTLFGSVWEWGILRISRNKLLTHSYN